MPAITELDIYAKIRGIFSADAAVNDWDRINCFAVAYPDEINANDLMNKPTSAYFFSRKWEDEGSDTDDFKIDYPLCLLYPPIDKPHPNMPNKTLWELDMLFLDLHGYDRDNNTETTYANRTKEVIWKDLRVIAYKFRDALDDIPNGYTVEPLARKHIELTRFSKFKIKDEAIGLGARLQLSTLNC